MLQHELRILQMSTAWGGRLFHRLDKNCSLMTGRIASYALSFGGYKRLDVALSVVWSRKCVLRPRDTSLQKHIHSNNLKQLDANRSTTNPKS